MSELTDDVRYADAGALIAETLDAFLPAARIGVADYAAEHRILMNEGGGYVGRWSNDKAPYLVAPMDACSSGLHRTVTIIGPAQSGKTEVAQNLLQRSIEIDPANLLWYQPTDLALTSYVKRRIDTMIAGHDGMKARLGLRPEDDSMRFKRFAGMWVEFLSATYSNMIGKDAPRIVVDEVDAYPESLGDVKALLDPRRQTFGESSLIVGISHPDRARGMRPDTDWTDGIAAWYADSDRRLWYWACPHCNGVSSPHPLGERVMTLVYPEKAPLEDIEAEAHLLCPLCGTLIEDRHRKAMNLTGTWIGTGQAIDENGKVTGALRPSHNAGFWIVGLMSPFLLGGIGGLARALVKAQRSFDVDGDDESLRTVVVKQFGLPFTPPKAVDASDADEVAEAADPRLALGLVANGVRALMAAVDVQGNRFEVLVRGFGEHGESWIVDFFALSARPATQAKDWDLLIDLLIKRSYPLAGMRGKAMKIRGIGIDSGGEAGVTQQIGDAWRRWKLQDLLKLYGKVGGRDVWSLVPTKGANGFRAPRLQVSYPDTSKKGRLGRGDVPLLLINPNLFKDDLSAQLAIDHGDPWSVHFPASLRSEHKPHLWFEQLFAERRDRSGRWEKIHDGVRNEALDLMVISHAVARLHGIGKINWQDPPAWAAPWERNSMIIDLELPTATAAETRVTTVPSVSAPVPARTVAPGSGIDKAEADRLRALIRKFK